MIEISELTKKYGELSVLNGINLTINAGEISTIVGASGAGKSTLLQIIGSLDKPSSGSVKINGTDLTQLSQKKVAQFRNENIGFVFQFHHLLPEFTAVENVVIPGMIAGKNKTELNKEAHRLLNFLNLGHRLTHKPSELSGGEQQRVAIARALINKPALILADEPSGNLDSKNADELHQLFRQLKNDLGQTFVIVTHNNAFAQSSDRIIELKDGKVLSVN